MNYFFAIKVHTFTHHVISMFSRQWQQSLPPGCIVRWYGCADYHITLRFLGDIPSTEEKALIDLIKPIALKTDVFSVDVRNYGAFPDLVSPKVLWMGIDSVDELEQLAFNINNALVAIGYTQHERIYKPHITIGRCRGRCGDVTIPYQPPSPEMAFGSFEVGGFTLMRTLPPNERQNGLKSRYNIVHLFPLGTPPSSAG